MAWSATPPRALPARRPILPTVPDMGQDGISTWRRRYVPQVGQATCGSFGLWHCGQLTSVGAAVFHCARRERVLLRDILRLGTATGCLLSVSGAVPAAGLVVLVKSIELAQRLPLGENRVLVPVSRPGVRETDSALDAQARAILAAERRQRQGEHHGVAQDRLQVEQVTLEQQLVLVVLGSDRLVVVQLLKAGFHRGGQRLEAASALTRHGRRRGAGDEHTFGHGLQPHRQVDIRSRGHSGQLNAQSVGRRYGMGLFPRGAGLAPQGSRVENEYPARVKGCRGLPAYMRHEGYRDCQYWTVKLTES